MEGGRPLCSGGGIRERTGPLTHSEERRELRPDQYHRAKVEAAVIASSRARTAIDARRVQARQMIGLSQVKTAEIATSPFDARMTNSCGS